MGAVVADVVITKLQADVDQYIAGINSAQSNFSQKLSIMQADAIRTGAAFSPIDVSAKKAFGTMSRDAPKAAQAIHGVNSELRYLPAQLNDIAVQLAGGQSPFLIAIQQGSQINQALGGLGTRGVVSALSGAFTSLINPTNLAVFALIAAAGAAVQFFSSMVEGSGKSQEELKKEAQLIQAVADKFGDVLPELKVYADEMKRAADEAERLAATDIVKANTIAKVQEDFGQLNQKIKDVITLVPDAQREFVVLSGKIEAGTQKASDFQRVISILKEVAAAQQTDYFDEAIKKLITMQTEAEKATRRITELQKQAAFHADPRDDIGTYSRDPSKPTVGLPSTAPSPDARPSFEDIGDSIAAAMIKKFESFVPSAKFDRTAFRVGFGSDTTTDAEGNKHQVTSDTTTTLDAANRDLERRIAEFQAAIVDSIGSDKFASFTQEQQAALTSIAYNYGSLPDRIVKSILSGASNEDIAKAIAGLQTDNGGINKDRRIQEAQTFASGTGFSAKEKTPAEIFQGKADDVQKRIETINAEVAAQNKLNPLVKDYGYEVEKARIAAELRNEAEQAGLVVDDGLAKTIDEYATNLAKAVSARNLLTESQKYAAEAVKQGSEFGKDLLGGFIRDLRDGKTAADALADALTKIAEKLLDVALNSAFDLGPGGTGGGGPLSFIGQLLSSFFRASGGPVRKGQPYIVGEKRAELFIPDTNGSIMPSVPNIATPARSASGGGGSLQVQSTVGVINGELVPLMTRVSGVVAGQQVKSASKQSPSRINSYQQRGT